MFLPILGWSFREAIQTKCRLFFFSAGILVLRLVLYAPASSAWVGEQYQTVPTAPPGEEGELSTTNLQSPTPTEHRDPNLVVIGIVFGVLLLIVLENFIRRLRWRKEEWEF